MEAAMVHVEVVQKNNSYLKNDQIKSLLDDHLFANKEQSLLKQVLDRPDGLVVNGFGEDLAKHIESVSLSVDSPKTSGDNYTLKLVAEKKYYIYQLIDDCYEEEMSDEDEGSDQLPAAQHSFLPSKELHGLWESLIYEDVVKDQLLRFALTSLMFADMKVDAKMITWNKVILLHGPPGTGKTSLCKALAQKLAIRLKNRYKYMQLIEINSHSLFSKWFSESGKLVMKLFQKIKSFVECGDRLVFVLIDEVESLAHTRQVSMNGTEPSDAIRVVNALLTQIDNIKNYSNVLILTTSNISGAIDLAFVDRADIKQHINLPSLKAVYEIFRSCIDELIKSGVISRNETLLNYQQLEPVIEQIDDFKEDMLCSYKLMQISKKSIGLSGRTLRKLPFLAVALFSDGHIPVKLSHFLECLTSAVIKQFKERQELEFVK